MINHYLFSVFQLRRKKTRKNSENYEKMSTVFLFIKGKKIKEKMMK